MSALRPLLVVLGLVASLLVAGIVIPSASAATVGVGVHGITPEGGYLGNHVAPDGSKVYCIDSARDWPVGPTGSGVVVTSLVTDGGTALSPAVLLRLDYALVRYGQTDDPIQAAAVNAYVYAYTSWYADRFGAGQAAGLHYVNGHAGVERAFREIWAATEAAVARPAPSATVEITMTSATEAIVSVETSAAGSGELTLDGAVSADTGLRTIPVTGSVDVPVVGAPADGAAHYTISAQLSLRSWVRSPAVRVYPTGDQQRTIRDGGSRQQEVAAAAQTDAIALPFTPLITSAVAAPVIALGEAAIDTLTVTVDAGRPWPDVDGSPVPVIAHGTLYGPFPDAPAMADAPPAGAPVAATEQLVLTGPGSYRSAGAVIPADPGHYTWVWRIDADAQPGPVRALLPAGYRFADRFGLPAETVEVTAPQLAATGSTAPPVAVAALLLGLGVALGNIARRRALRSA